MKIPPLTLVQLNVPESTLDYKGYYENILGVNNLGEHLLCLGEISNMPNHYAVCNSDGQIKFGLHADIFKIVSEEET